MPIRKRARRYIRQYAWWQGYPSVKARLGYSLPCVLVPRVIHITGYSLFSFTRAVAVVNFQSALACFLLRLFSQAVTSATRVCLSEIRRSRH